MSHYIFTDTPKAPYPIAILIKELAFNKPMIEKYYVEPLEKRGIPREECIALPLKYSEQNKCTIKQAKEYLAHILKWLKHFETEYLLVTDPVYFKALTRVGKVEPHHGYVLPCKIEGYDFNVIYSVNFSALFYNPKLIEKLEMSLNTLQQHKSNFFIPLGHSIIHSESYPETPSEVRQALERLHQYGALTCDIETFSLAFYTAGIGTIAFAWDQHNGLAIPVDIYNPHGSQIRKLLKEFFLNYGGELVFHGGTFDIKVLVYGLFMKNISDVSGMLKGIEVLTNRIHDTKLISYLATNTTSGNDLKLKNLAHEFAGNYAQDDIKDIRKISKEDLLRYNLVDCLATWYVKNKYYPIMVEDQQEEIYKTIFLASMPTIIQMELTGMPLDLQEVANAKREMEEILWSHESVLRASPLIFEFEDLLREKARNLANAKLKVKIKPLQDFVNIEFNPNSDPQIRQLLYEHWELDPIDFTDTGLPATGADTLKKVLVQLQQKFNILDEEIK